MDYLKYALKYPNLAMRELNRFWHTRIFSRDHNTSGDDFMDEEWDNLILLDACRYDMFEERNELEGELQSRNSKGSATIGFLKGNFGDKDFHDTVYLTANPQLEWNRDKVDPEFFKVIDLWEDDYYWSEKLNTVPPEKVTEKAKEVAKKYPEKRIIIHYMQPHTPFLSEDLEEGPLTEYIFWHSIMEGEKEVPQEKAWRMYNRTLDRALDSIENLVHELDGRTVITADHGNMVGERSFPIPVTEWGHPNRTYVEELVKVPWLVASEGGRKITEEDPKEEEKEVDEEEVKEKLEALGYQ